MSKFSYDVDKDYFTKISLKAKNKEDISTIRVAVDKGNNMFKYKYNEFDLIYYNDNLPLDHFLNGNPIIYPLPNRVNNCHYEFQGKKYWQQKNSKPIFLHSLVYDEKWSYEKPKIADDHISLKTYLNVDESHPVYEGFPFEHKLIIYYKLYVNKLRIKYTIKNHDQKELPYGICFHTYFNYLNEREDTYLKIPAKHYMELDEDLIPTGSLLDTKNSKFDFNDYRSLKSVDLDGALTNIKKSPQILFKERLKVDFDYSKEFTHLQLYTPLNKLFFCLEMQTCSADAHNLEACGKNESAHLLSVKPLGKSNGWLDYKPKLC